MVIRGTYYGPGELPDRTMPGDFFLTRRPGSLMGTLITFGQKIRLEPEDAKWSHAVLVTHEDGFIQEALEFGVELEHIDKYRDYQMMYYETYADYTDVKQMMDFADAVYESKENYGYVTIASVIVSLATGSKFVFGRAGSSICSGFVAETLCRAGYIFPKPPSYMTPGDLNSMFRKASLA